MSRWAVPEPGEAADADTRLQRASVAELERWAERVLTAGSLDAVFAD